MIGQTVSHYRIISRIGAGEMEAWLPETNRPAVTPKVAKIQSGLFKGLFL